MRKEDVLTPEQKTLYQEMENTFNTPGWSYLIKGWEKTRDSLKEQVFFGAGDFEDVQHARIRYQLLNELIELPAQYAISKDQAIEEARERLSQEDD